MAIKLPSKHELHFEMDKHLNRFIPPSPLHRLPKPLSWCLGYANPPRKEIGNLLISFWTLIGTFAGLILVMGVFRSPGIEQYHPPIIIASFGASAVLEYNVIKSPLGQPRNSIVGHTLSALTGVIINKLFLLNPSYESLRWVAGAVSCSVASVVMSLTNSAHPPGGATALIAVVDPNVAAMGWALIPIVVLGTTLMLVVALLVNNIQRQFPVFWWTPDECGQFWTDLALRRKKTIDDVESQKEAALQREKSDDDESDLRPVDSNMLTGGVLQCPEVSRLA